MADGDQIADMINDFPELAGNEVHLHKEVLAHFGLLFSSFANLEESLHNVFVFWQLRRVISVNPEITQFEWSSHHNKYVEEVYKLTFGRLINKLQDVPEIRTENKELSYLKNCRNYFSHRFFREENHKMYSDNSKIQLIAHMNALRKRVDVQDDKLKKIYFPMFRELYPEFDIDSEFDLLRQQYNEQFETLDSAKFGWEKLESWTR